MPEIALPARRASSSNENGAYTSAKRPRYWVDATARMAQLSCSASRSANSFLSSRVARSSSSSLTAVAIMNEPPE